MSIPQYEAHEKLGAATVAMATAAMAIIPAAFWASVALLVWGLLAAIIVAIIGWLGSILVMALVRSGGEIETPASVAWTEIGTPQLAPRPPTVPQAA